MSLKNTLVLTLEKRFETFKGDVEKKDIIPLIEIFPEVTKSFDDNVKPAIRIS